MSEVIENFVQPSIEEGGVCVYVCLVWVWYGVAGVVVWCGRGGGVGGWEGGRVWCGDVEVWGRGGNVEVRRCAGVEVWN